MSIKHRGARLSSLLNLVSNVGLFGLAGAMVFFYLKDRQALDVMASRAEATVPDNWRAEIHTGISMGSETASFTIVEFMDFQCPYCARWAAVVDSLMHEFPEDVRVVLHHFPLQSHRLAIPAAIAAECADRQGFVAGFYKLLFAEQTQIGTKSWTDFASNAGVPDVRLFEACTTLPSDSFPRIKYGRALGDRTGVRSTPTVWLNGEVSRGTLDELREMVRASR